MSTTDQAELEHATGAPRSIGVHENRHRQQTPSAANDNYVESARPLPPFPNELGGIPFEKQEDLSNWLAGSIGQALLCEDIAPAIQNGFSSTPWRAMLGKLTYFATASIAMLGWLYLLWLAGSFLVGTLDGA